MQALSSLEARIQMAKRELVEIYMSKGFTDNQVLKASQRVDRLLNEYQILMARRAQKRSGRCEIPSSRWRWRRVLRVSLMTRGAELS